MMNKATKKRIAILATPETEAAAGTIKQLVDSIGESAEVYAVGEDSGVKVKEFIKEGGDFFLVPIVRGMALGTDGADALYYAMSGRAQIMPIGAAGADDLWQSIIPLELPELCEVQAYSEPEAWLSKLRKNNPAKEGDGLMLPASDEPKKIWSEGPDSDAPEVVLTEDDALEPLPHPVQRVSASPGHLPSAAPQQSTAEQLGKRGGAISESLLSLMIGLGVCGVALIAVFLYLMSRDDQAHGTRQAEKPAAATETEQKLQNTDKKVQPETNSQQVTTPTADTPAVNEDQPVQQDLNITELVVPAQPEIVKIGANQTTITLEEALKLGPAIKNSNPKYQAVMDCLAKSVDERAKQLYRQLISRDGKLPASADASELRNPDDMLEFDGELVNAEEPRQEDTEPDHKPVVQHSKPNRPKKEPEKANNVAQNKAPTVTPEKKEPVKKEVDKTFLGWMSAAQKEYYRRAKVVLNQTPKERWSAVIDREFKKLENQQQKIENQGGNREISRGELIKLAGFIKSQIHKGAL